jgi:AsmA protein
LKEQVQKFVKDQTGMTLKIGGDVSLSLITGLELSAQTVSLQDQNDKPLFDVEELDFALALTPLMQGQADIRAITLNRPTFTLTQSKPAPKDDPIRALAEQQDQPQSAGSSSSGEIDLSSLRLQRLSLRDAKLVSLSETGENSVLLDKLDADLSIPDFNGPANLSGTLLFKEKELQLEGQIAHVSNAINGKETRLSLTSSSDLHQVGLEANLALKSATMLSGNLSLQSQKLKEALAWLRGSAPGLNANSMQMTASIIAGASEVQLRSVQGKIGEQGFSAAARFFTAQGQQNPLLRLALDIDSLNLDQLLATPTTASKQSNSTQSSQSTGSTSTTKDTPDLSALAAFNATVDLRVKQLTTQGIRVDKVKLLANLVNGNLQANLNHASLAKGTVGANLQGTIKDLLWSGSFRATKLDLPMLAKLAGQQSPAEGMISANVNFAAKGLEPDILQKNANLAGELRLTQGRVQVPALQAAIPTKQSGVIDNLSLTAKLDGLDRPATLSGRMTWNGETISYDSRIGLAEVLASQAIPASVTLKSAPLNASLSGRFSPTSLSLNGSKVALSSPSSRALMAWLGQAVNKGTPNVPISLQSNLALSPSKTSLEQLSLSFGQSKGNGSLSITTAAKPVINASLAFNKLDITPLMGDGTEQGRTGSASSGSGSRKSSGSQAAPNNSPIDFSGLNTIDADLKLSANSLIAKDIVTGKVSLVARLKDGQLQASLDQLSLYEGTGTGGITLNAKAQPAQMSANFSLGQMQMAYFLRDAVGMKSLSGRGGTQLALTTTGASQADLMRNLNGTASLAIRDGQIRGINIPQMLRTLQGNILEGWASSEAQSTDFSSLQASFNIKNGIATNQDLQMLGPLVRLTGAGQIDLVRQRINYKATPKLVTKLRGQGGLVNADGVPIPIIIEGKLAKPRIYPDLPGILQNPQAVLQGLRNLGGAGKAAAKGLEKLDKNITKELTKQGEKLGIDLNKFIKPKSQPNQQQQGQQNTQPQKQQPVEQQLFNSITKGLFGN